MIRTSLGQIRSGDRELENAAYARLMEATDWKVGVAGERQRRVVLRGLETPFRECETEKNRTLVRYDVLEGMKRIHEGSGDDTVRERALEWIGLEEDPKYRKKYSAPFVGAPGRRGARTVSLIRSTGETHAS